MAENNRISLRLIVIIYFWIFQFIIGYVAVSLLFGANPYFYYPVSAEKHDKDVKNTGVSLEAKCRDCKLTSNSIEDIIKKPRQMDSYGQVHDRIDLEKIKKGICKDIYEEKDKERCRDFFFSNLPSIEKWKQSNSRASFFDLVCIKELRLCCPRNSYGATCNRCPECNQNERCEGEGTRDGNGTCICREGHTGPRCTSCLGGFYSDLDKLETKVKDAPVKKVICKRCHRSCLTCRQEGPLGCDVCQSGFTWIPSFGCTDIDECIQNNKTCGDNTFCVNTIGSYFCYECDRACDGCHGDGPDMCLKCAKGFKAENGNCIAPKKTLIPPEANYYRYAIYLGLCICTCIILHNNVYLASLVGLGVALYIGVCEYVMSNHSNEMQKL